MRLGITSPFLCPQAQWDYAVNLFKYSKCKAVTTIKLIFIPFLYVLLHLPQKISKEFMYI